MIHHDQTGQLEAIADDTQGPTVQTARWVVGAMLLIASLASAALFSSWRDSKEAQNARKGLSGEIQGIRDSYNSVLVPLQEQLAQAQTTNVGLQAELLSVKQGLQLAQNGVTLARKQAQQLNNRQGEEIRQLAAMDTEVKKQLATKANSEDVKAMNGEVIDVRNELNTAKSDLQMTRSEMGTLIAKNHDDIEVLRRRGERDYFEFTIAGKNTPQKMGDVTIELRSTDSKKNQCNLAFVLDDKHIEKRDRTIDEPIFFYRHGEKQPLEVVINHVEKNKVVGYLSVPKEKLQVALAGGN